MTQPLGYYGLKFEADIEAELMGLRDKPLLELLNDLVASVRFHTSFSTYCISADADEAIEALPKVQRLALVRWICTRIEAEEVK
ncbi:hypothetical protein [Pseudanabaena mucicola]|uniref:Uncharacterized protein n=1 Tax=Pseudanabaena mucicola FACHB-723 TaxID=2692860 RepID=A0ABR8A0J0_9CYAN|nr:hypothetical protein [Pseudanabaena mucicola]MBD2189761.1 hypothetical protein [Pseudanabaena mucicola FACHB-723]